MRYNARLDCLITLYQKFSMYVKDKAAKKGECEAPFTYTGDSDIIHAIIQ